MTEEGRTVDLNEALASPSLKHITAPVRWLDSHSESLVRTLAPSEPGYAYGPHDIGTEQRVESVRLPAVGLHAFENAIVSSPSSSVFLGDLVVAERVEGVDPSKCDFRAGHLVGHDATHASIVIQGGVVDIPRGVFLGGNGASNYYHFLVEILPRLQHVFDDGMFASYPLLVDGSVERVPNFRRLIEIASGGHPYLVLQSHRSYRVGRLAYVSTPNTSPFNLQPGVTSELSHTLLRPSTIAYLRELFFRAVDASAADLPKRVFFERKPGLRDYNRDEIRAIFAEYGFVPVNMGDLSVAQQVGLMGQVDMVAGPSGAAWANLVFCREGAEALCWMAETAPNWAVFSTLAKAAGVNLHYLRHSADVSTSHELYRLNYRLDPADVRRAIKQLWGLPAPGKSRQRHRRRGPRGRR